MAEQQQQQKRQLLLVDGPVTTVLNVEVAREVDTLDFFDKVQIPRNSVSTPLLPHNTLQYKSTNTVSKYILQEPPSIWMVSHANAGGAIFQIAVPWTLFSVAVGHGSGGAPQTIGQPVIVFSRAKIQSEDTRLAKSFLPNQQDSGLCCAGDDYARIMSSRDPLLEGRQHRPGRQSARRLPPPPDPEKRRAFHHARAQDL